LLVINKNKFVRNSSLRNRTEILQKKLEIKVYCYLSRIRNEYHSRRTNPFFTNNRYTTRRFLLPFEWWDWWSGWLFGGCSNQCGMRSTFIVCQQYHQKPMRKSSRH